MPLVADTLALKATVASLNRDGYYDNRVYDEELGDKDRKVAHIQLLWDPRDDLSFLYSYDMTDVDEAIYPAQIVDYNPAIQPGLAPWIGDGSESYRYFDRPGSSEEADIDGHSLTISWDINDNLSLVSISGLRAFDVESTQDADDSPLFMVNNDAGDAEIKGAELEVVAWLSEHLEIGGGYGYLDPEYKTCVNSQDQDLSGNHWAHAPNNNLNTYARYVVPDFQSLGDLIFRVDWSWVDDHFLLTDKKPGEVDGNTAPSYDFVNARVTLDQIEGPSGTKFSVSLWGRNLTDEL